MSSLVPDGWSFTDFGQISSNRKTKFQPEIDSERFVYLGLEHLGVASRKIRDFGSSVDVMSTKTKFYKGDTLFGKLRPYLRKVAYPDFDGICSTDILALSPCKNTDAEFLFYICSSDEFIANAVESSAGNIMPRASWGDLVGFPILYPPLPEQKKIASILTSVDEVIENTQKQIDKLQDLKKATMNELLTKGIGHTEFKDSELGRIPKSWEVKRLDEINFKIVVGYVGNVNDFYCDASEGVPFYRTQNIRPDRFVNKTNVSVTKDFHAKNNKSRIENGDVLIARVGANLGMVCEVKGVLGEANAANVIIINRREDYSSEFLSLFLNSEKGKGSILVDAMGGAQGVFNTTIAKSLLVPVTTKKEMSEIARVIASIQGSIAKQQNKLVQTQSLKKSLMQDLLTGKVRVTVN